MKQVNLMAGETLTWSHSARSAWIETLTILDTHGGIGSHSARSAWIETFMVLFLSIVLLVALRKECVD